MEFNKAVLDAVDQHAPNAVEAAVPLLLSVEEAAQRLGIGQTLMRALVSSGEVESVKIGRLQRVPEDALGTYVQHLRDRSARLRDQAG